MLTAIAAFECRQRLRSISTYVYFTVLFALAVFFVAVMGGAVKGATIDFGTGSKVNVNSPYALNAVYVLIASFGTPIVAAIAGRAVYQDIDYRSTELFFSAPITKLQYLGGRFLGAFLVLLGLHAAIGLGAFACIHGGLVDSTRLGPETALSYIEPYAIAIVPNLFIGASLFFSLATLLRKMVPAYVGGVLLTLGYFIGSNLAGDISNRRLAALVDLFGLQAFDRLTEYWTVADRNTRLLPFEGVLAENRMLWVGASAALLLVTWARFRFDEPRTKERRDATLERAAVSGMAGPVTGPATPAYSRRASLAQLFELTRLQLRETVKNVFFLVLVLAGLLFVVAIVLDGDMMYGTRTYPVTYQVLELTERGFGFFVLIITTLYAGELTWRERDAHFSEVVDALPIRRWVLFTSKLFALFGVEVLLVSIVMVAGIATQTLKGYFVFEIGLYFQRLFLISLPRFLILATLAMAIHAVVDNKYVGHFVMVLYLLVSIALPLVGFEHHLYRFAAPIDLPYSDMNGFGHFVEPAAWLLAYWAAAAVFLAVVAELFWVRGTERSLLQRLRLARARLGKAGLATLAGSATAFVAIGAFIFFNTNVCNHYRTSYEKDDDRASYEKKYKPRENDPRPTMTANHIEVDIDPPSRSAVIRGVYTFENKTAMPISSVSVSLDPRASVKSFEFDRGSRKSTDDSRLGFYVFELERPMNPGETSSLQFDIAYRPRGFVLRDSDTHFAYNGTFFTSDYLPAVGYKTGRELTDDETRHRHDLPPKHLLDVDDPVGRTRNNGGAEVDFIDFDAVVSTTADQTGIAPGVMDREWTSSGRRYFHYKVDGPMLSFVGFLSGRYAVRRDAWNDVAIEIDYHPSHAFNVERMIDGIKRSLDYFTTNFGPYQNRQVRIVEFPRYERFAMSLAAMIPYSESIGFIAKVDDKSPSDVDFPFYATAHEVAHQWWAHQVIGADVQGGEVLSETLSQYSALMVMKQRYGERSMRRFLRYELDRYLRGRGLAKKREQPLARVESDGYIHYNKGSLAMYALQDAIGEDRVNAVLRRLCEKFGRRGAPYPTTGDLLAGLRDAAPEERRSMIEDLFETITLYDNRAVKATIEDLGGDEHEVHVEALAKKLRADELGHEKEVPLDDIIDVGVLDREDNVLALEKVRVRSERVEATVRFRGKAAKAGIDPRNMLVDRKPDDNVVPATRD
jgi:ABC-type transport system involved in multi-copper enzyme maturation permease subunit